MRASLITRGGSVAAAAVIATTGAMAAAGAADASTHHAHRLRTHLSIVKVRHHKHAFVIAGRLTTFRHALPHRLVFLDTIAGKEATAVAHERTNRAGVAAFVVDPAATTKYVLVFEGTPRLHSSHSRVVVVKG